MLWGKQCVCRFPERAHFGRCCNRCARAPAKPARYGALDANSAKAGPLPKRRSILEQRLGSPNVRATDTMRDRRRCLVLGWRRLSILHAQLVWPRGYFDH